MAKKTAMNELISWLECGWKDEDVDTVIKKANELLEIEKEQIIKSNESGFEDGVSFEKWGNPIFGTAKQYYNKTYGSQAPQRLKEANGKIK